jgi:hypothetical protein
LIVNIVVIIVNIDIMVNIAFVTIDYCSTTGCHNDDDDNTITIKYAINVNNNNNNKYSITRGECSEVITVNSIGVVVVVIIIIVAVVVVASSGGRTQSRPAFVIE